MSPSGDDHHHEHDHGHGDDHRHEAGREHRHDHEGRGHPHSDHDHEGRGHGHAHDHGHGGHHHHHHGRNAAGQRLWVALAILATFTAVEAVGGFWANSVALLAEAAHMLADCGSLILAVVAIRVSQRPARADRTYGHGRYQTLAAYTNGLILLALTVGVVIEAVRRFLAPPEVNGTVMLGVAALGGVANLAAFLVLSGRESLNERGARAHVLSDLLGSGAAMVGAVIILTTGWFPADPLLSLFVSALIFRSGWQLTRQSAHVLLEGAPAEFDVSEVERELKEVPSVRGVHHIHAWSLTGETPMLTLHADLIGNADRQLVLFEITQRLRSRFGIEHATVQFEEGECVTPDASDGCHDTR